MAKDDIKLKVHEVHGYSAPEQKSKIFVFSYFFTDCLASIPISKNITKLTVNLTKNAVFFEIQTFPIEAVLYRTDW